MASVQELSHEEWAVIQKLRELRATYVNFKLVIYGQGSSKRSILDMEWSPRMRLSETKPLSVAIDD